MVVICIVLSPVARTYNCVLNEQSDGESLAALQDTKHTKNGLEICFSHTET